MNDDLLHGVERPIRVRSNRLYYGDNMTIMRNMPSACVDLVYLDPPFNSQRTYNLIYKQMTGLPLPEQEEAFCDAWDLDPEKEEMARRMPIVLREYGVDHGLVEFWTAWINALRQTQPRLLAYLVYMTYRLFEIRRVLRPTGSVYLHCDPTAGHYIKVLMDSIFHHTNFRNEIVWKRTGTHSDSRTWSRVDDRILFYTKGDKFTWNIPRDQHSPEYIASKYRFKDDNGRRYRLDNMTSPNPRPNMMYEWKGFPSPEKGWRFSRETMARLDAEERIWYPLTPTGEFDHNRRPQLRRYLDEMSGGGVMGTVWTDIAPINSQANERLGYPTQKPLSLLRRIIRASSNEGEVVFDPFCGCGSAIVAAHLENRKWIGCDIAIWSVRIVRDVLLKRYGLKEKEHYEITGIPASLDAAQDLFERDPHQFQKWAVEFAGGFSGNRSGDRGIDGRIYYETSNGLRNMVISVKGGKLTPAYVRELRGVMERENDTDLSGFICLQEPTKGMAQEAAAAGMHEYLGKDYPRLQIRTAEELLSGKGFDTPSRVQTLNWEKQSVLPL